MEVVLQDTGTRIEVSDVIFGSVFNQSLVHQVITSYLSSARQGTRAQKNRSLVSGSSKKPWRQKGTGRARAGSIRSPIWRSGGVTFAARPKDYRQKINKKMYRGALRSIFSELLRQDRLVFVNYFDLQAAKTRMLVDQLYKMDLKNDVLILVDYNILDKKLFLAARNLYKVKVCFVGNINPYILVTFNTVLVTMESIKSIEDMLI